jgi:hypothetical protein
MHAKLAGFIRCSGHHASLVPLASNHHGLTFECRIEQLFHRDKEGVHIDVKDDASGRCQLRGGHILKIHQGKESFVRFSLAQQTLTSMRIADSSKLWLLRPHLMVTVVGLERRV